MHYLSAFWRLSGNKNKKRMAIKDTLGQHWKEGVSGRKVFYILGSDIYHRYTVHATSSKARAKMWREKRRVR